MNTQHIDYSNELILVVDDEEAVRGPIIQMLNRLGFKTGSKGNAKAALRELAEKQYTFLLTDIRMPEVDGLELIKQSKQDYPDVCTIAMTGYSKEYKYIDVVNAGATDFINKPFGIEELEAKIRRAINERNIKNELSRLSVTDSLTGLYNQRHFYARLKEEITRAQRGKHQLALILFDLDKFKQYNDSHGHVAGDELLKKVGRIVETRIRENVDSGYRYGGDEFAVILIDAGADIGRSIANRIEKAIQEECGLSASMGYTEFSEGMTPETFVDEADRLLYESKGKRLETTK
jgi:two-component system cell cycle response regulator